MLSFHVAWVGRGSPRTCCNGQSVGDSSMFVNHYNSQKPPVACLTPVMLQMSFEEYMIVENLRDILSLVYMRTRVCALFAALRTHECVRVHVRYLWTHIPCRGAADEACTHLANMRRNSACSPAHHACHVCLVAIHLIHDRTLCLLPRCVCVHIL